MKIKFLILIASILLLAFVISFPMRGLVKLANFEDSFTADEIKGFWWDARFKNSYIGSKKIGNIDFSLDPYLLLSGQLGFNLKISGPEINLHGRVGVSLRGTYSLEHLTFEFKPLKKFKSGKVITQTISSINGYIDYIYFNRGGCLDSNGTAKGELLDDFGLFTRNLTLNINIKCRNELLELKFLTLRSDLLEGEVLVSPDLNYNLEARSKRISSKIKEISKFNFKSKPSLKLSGRLIDILDYL